MNILKTLAAATALSVVMSAPAMADVKTVSFTNIKAEWYDWSGGFNVVPDNNGTPDASVEWGKNGRSGYAFTTTLPAISVDTDIQMSGLTTIGEFTHFNYVIDSGSGISSIKLKLLMDVYVGDDLVDNVAFYYSFNHWETPNGSNPCADGNPHGSGVNVNGCADNVRVNFLQDSGSFTLDGFEYALDVEGFLLPNGSEATTFWTKEKATNTAELQGRVVLRSLAGAVPEPATWAMMIGGFAIAGASLRRRKTAVSFA
ncbi:MAG: hypothetical protein BGP16_09895 [Sphingobium sp. 66-54]|nr:MAG: hypothetical protein BGP16_09895 [Sphingobium sp. 66-54]